MHKLSRKGLVLAGSLLAASVSVQAIPIMQIGIDGGTYIAGDIDDTVINASSFTILAMTTEMSLLDNPIMISLALVELTGDGFGYSGVSAGGSYGSVSVDGGTPFSVTGAMTYGTPPLLGGSPEIAPHGVYETYFAEFTIAESSWVAGTICNVEAGEETDCAAGYQSTLDIDISSLAEGFGLHFDLYARDTNPGGDIIVFAPFSHDATGFDIPGGGGNPQCLLNPLLCTNPPVPEPGMMSLFGAGLLAMGLPMVWRRRKSYVD